MLLTLSHEHEEGISEKIRETFFKKCPGILFRGRLSPFLICRHKTFGEGTISFMDKAQKKIRVQFHVGEKMFLYPDAFVNGHLSV